MTAADVPPGKVLEHLECFRPSPTPQRQTGSGTSGYRGTVDYVVGRRGPRLHPRVPELSFPFFQEVSPATVSAGGRQLAAEDVAVMTYSGSGTVTAPVQAVGTTGEMAASTSGCEAGDFADFVPGNIALLQRGTCAFGVKAANAAAAGASAVLIFNTGLPGAEGAVAGTLGEPGVTTVPVVGLSYAAGVALLGGGEVTVSTQTVSESRETFNVLVETRSGDPERTVMVGAHLDSVPEGPGINDNASGSAGILAIAEVLAGTETANAFASPGGGGGVRPARVPPLRRGPQTNDPRARERRAVPELRMIGSPNHGRFVYDGDASAFGRRTARCPPRRARTRSRRPSTSTSAPGLASAKPSSAAAETTAVHR